MTQPLNPLPEGLQVQEQEGKLVAIRRWYTPTVWLTLIFCLVWNGFMFNWYVIAFNHPTPNNMALWFPVIHVGVGIWLVYSVLTGFLNRTEVLVGNGQIVVRHGPLPWAGNKSVEAGNIQQLFCDEIVSRGRGATTKFRLNAVLLDGRKETLVSAGLSRDQVLYLEQAAEKKLGIKPAPVVGELGS